MRFSGKTPIGQWLAAVCAGQPAHTGVIDLGGNHGLLGQRQGHVGAMMFGVPAMHTPELWAGDS